MFWWQVAQQAQEIPVQWWAIAHPCSHTFSHSKFGDQHTYVFEPETNPFYKIKTDLCAIFWKYSRLSVNKDCKI